MSNDHSVTDRRKALLRRRLEQQGLASEARGATAPPREPGARFPLSPGQQRIWFLQQLEPSGTTLNICVAYTIEGDLDVDRLGDALATVHARHDILRTTYHAGSDGEPYLTVAETVTPVWAMHDIAGLDDEAREVLARREFARPFDLDADLPLRTTVVRTGPTSHTLVLVVHHIAWDDDCWDPFFADLSAAYTADLPAARDGVAQHLDLTVLDRADTERADADAIAYWRAHLSEPPEPLELPGENGITALPDPAAGHASTQLPAGLLDEVRELARAEGATTFMALLAAFDAVVYRYTGTGDFLVATPVVDRPAGGERALGYFGNTLALRASVAPTDTFRTLVTGARTEASGAFAHQGVGVDRLVAEVAPHRRDGLANLARLSFAARTGGAAGLTVTGLTATGLTTRRADLHAAVAQVPLGLMVEWSDSGISDSGATVEAEYLLEVLDADVVENLLAHYVRLLDALVQHPDEPLRSLDMLGADDRAQLRALATGARFDAAAVTLPALVQAQVARTPDAVALVADDIEITFDELDRRANRVAHWLISRGVGPDDLVALSFGRSVDMVVVAYGVLKAGAAYVPVDPTYPPDRIEFMLSDAAPTVALSPGDNVEDLARDFPDATPTDADRVRPLRLDNLAYVIYTSGSTGTPKGVPVPHGAIVEYLDWLRAEYVEGPDDSLLQVASPSFDVSVGEMFGTLAGGARLVIPKPDGLEDIGYLTDLLLSKKVSAMHFVPSLLGLFLMMPGVSEWTSLRRIPIGGEPLPGELADKFRATFDAMLHNFYGPTETVLAATRYKVSLPQGVRIVPIGRPKINTEVFLLDEGLQPVPTGVIGEVYIGGSQLARGYLRRPALTAERFVADPFTPGGRLYRTGDVARWNTDGNIEFIGRADEQVKIRGFRIELGEVQAAVTAHPAVDACIVVATETPTLGKILVAYVVGGAPIDLDAVRGVAAAGLPEYMVPTAFVQVDSIPLTANGKLDRDLLPEPKLAPRAVSRPPSTDTEEMLCEAFAAALGVESVGVDDSFFELGGHSLLATRLVSRLRAELGVELSIREAFDAPTVSGLAALIDAKIAAAETVRRKPLTRAVREEKIPLSYAQLRQWFLYRLEGPNPTYNIPFAARLEGPVDVPAMVAALADVVRRHEALRTTFPDENGTPYQAINDLDHDAIVAGITVCDLAAGETVDDVLAAARNHCFDLDVDVPIRAQIVAVGEQQWVLSVVIHHIAGDEWSVPVLFGDLRTAYAARLDGNPPQWSEPEIQYADYALWQRDMLEAEGEHQIDYWRKQLDGVPEDTTVVRDRTRPAVASARGVTVPFAVSPEVRAGLTELARDTGASEFMVLEAAVAVLLSRLGAGPDVPLGTPIAGRNEAALSELVGFFVNTIVLRNDLSSDPTLREIVTRARQTALDAYAHQDLPFERLVDALNPERSLSLHPLFQVLVHLRESGEFSETIAGGARFSTITPEFDTVKFDLAFDFYPDGDGYGGGIAYRSELYDPETVDTLARRVDLVLRALAFAPETRLSQVDVLGVGERAAALGARSDGGAPVPGAVGTIPEVLAQSRSHTGTAVVCAGEEIGYPELHERSDRLAALLAARGAGPERFVGIAVPRSIDMLVALLAVIKTGAGFLPLDLRYPRQRLELMITDATPVVVLTTAATQGDLPVAKGSPALAFDAEAVIAELERAELATVAVGEFAAPSPDNVAYFLFTSGSTGLPKGVLGTQRGFANRVCWQPVRYPVAAPDVRLAQGALSFLDSPLELIAALAAGATLVLADDREARDLTALAELLRRYPIAQVTAVASAVSALIEIAPEAIPTVRRWVCSGEPMTASLLSRLSAAAPDSEIVNSYGTTETSGANVRGTLRSERVRVGSPVPGVRVLILDERLQPAPIGVIGEVYVAGAQLSRGYWNRFGLTSGRFIANPFPAVPGERIYRTGDRARWNNQGEMEFGGRVDHQVNVRGFRIELGEVEAALRAAPGVTLAAARVHELDGAPAIAAYVTTADPDVDEGSFVATVRAHIASQLPGYMLPTTVTMLETMPLTGSGKLNRPALPAPTVRTSGAFAPPVTDTERTLATVLEDVLGVSRVGRADGFFALGGDSIVSIQFAARARVHGLELTPQMVFENPTVAELADALDRGAAAGAQEVAESTPMSASGLDDDALAALQASWNTNR